MSLVEVDNNGTDKGYIPADLETEPKNERALGEYEQKQLIAREMIKMSQVRGEKNKVSEEMKDSIEAVGLINPIDVAHLDEDALREYISFVNRVWHSNTTFEDFDDCRQPDGTFYLVIAGHSRHEAITELQQEGRLSPERLIQAKVHEVISPEQIIEIQIAENIHSQPPRERRAIAIVESYEWGIETGKWANQNDYLKKHNSVGKSSLSDALGFSHIPAEIRSFILKGNMPYTVGVELGRAAEDVRKYVAFKANIKTKRALVRNQKKLEKRVVSLLAVESNNILRSKLNSTAAEKRIRSWRQTLQDEMATAEEIEVTTELSLFEFDLKSSEELLEEQETADKNAIKEFMRSYGRTPNAQAFAMMQLNSQFVDKAFFESVTKDYEQSLLAARRSVGSIAAADAAPSPS